MSLAEKKCVPCEGNMAPLTKVEIEQHLKLVSGWSIKDGKVTKDFSFEDFNEALKFVNEVGMIAEKEGHHPDIYFTWGKCKIQIYTHSIKGLSENDFILAAKIDEILK